MICRFSVHSTVGLAAILAIGGCTLLLAQEPATGRAGANAPRQTPAVLVMKAEFKAAVAGKTEQLPFVQANVVDPNLELKQYGAGKDVLTNAGNPAQFIPFSAWTGMTAGPFALTFRDKTNLLDLSGGAEDPLGHEDVRLPRRTARHQARGRQHVRRRRQFRECRDDGGE